MEIEIPILLESGSGPCHSSLTGIVGLTGFSIGKNTCHLSQNKQANNLSTKTQIRQISWKTHLKACL